MWNFIFHSIISAYQLLIAEPEHLIFAMVVFLIVLTFSFILRVCAAIQKERIVHQVHIKNYHKFLVASEVDKAKNNFREEDFNKKQLKFLQDISEVKNQFISLRLILNSISKP